VQETDLLAMKAHPDSFELVTKGQNNSIKMVSSTDTCAIGGLNKPNN
jgi:hypothetical protein